MAQFEFRMPDIGEGVSEGQVTGWLVKVGDAVSEDDPMLEIMTDKATVTIGAPKKGRIQEIRFKEGDTAKVGQVLVVIDMAGGAATEAAAPAAAPATSNNGGPKQDGPAATAVGDIKDGLPGSNFFQGKKPAVASASLGAVPTPAEYWNPKPLATPATRKLARDLSIDLRRVKPSHPSGRVTKDDLRGDGGASAVSAAHRSTETVHGILEEPVRHIPEALPATKPTVLEPVTPSARVEETIVGMRAPSGPGSALEVRKPMTGVRRIIAERMQHSKNTAAHFTFVEECNSDALIALRKRLVPRAEASGVKLSFLPFIVKAVVAALKKHPILNSSLDPQTSELVFKGYYNVGIATATEQGLMVPVVRDADRKSIVEIAKDIDRLGEGARTGKLTRQDLTGSTFTITSLGKQGGLFATPVLNFPEVGILGVHQMKERPVVRDGQIVIGNVMLLSLSFDHRIVDGHIGAAFAYDIIACLEDPERLFLEMS
jgi:pyruvate dehydrogenase E2 component (dihydrolipoamide acetyltransferase)